MADKVKGVTDEQLKAEFARLDVDGNGCLSSAEFKEVIRGCAPDLDEETLGQVCDVSVNKSCFTTVRFFTQENCIDNPLCLFIPDVCNSRHVQYGFSPWRFRFRRS